MEFVEGIEFQKADTLHSGQFYWVHAVSHCYRINEVDHFRRDLVTDLLCYLDQEETCHHFNRLVSKYTAKTRISDLMQTSNLKEIEFFELNQNSADQLRQSKLSVNGSEPSALLAKTVAAFYEQRDTDSGTAYGIHDLKSKYMKSYIQSLEIR